MAGPVTGTFGTEPIELNNAATEETLLKLLAAMQAMSKAKGLDPKESNKNLQQLATQSGAAAEQVEELGEAAESSSGMLAGAFNMVAGTVKGLGEEFLQGSMRISDFSSHIAGALSTIPVVGGALGGGLQLLTSIVDNNIDNFRQLSGVGVDFGGSLFEAQRNAARAGLQLSTFSEVIQNNAVGLAQFGGSAAEGARIFTRVSGIVQNQFGQQFSNLGLTMEETAEATAEYMDLQRKSGRAGQMTDRQLAQGTANYVQQLDLLSKITGKRRDQIADEIQGRMDEVEFRALMSSVPETTQTTINGILTQMGNLSPELERNMQELLYTGGTPISEAGRAFAQAHPELRAMAAGVRDGTVSQEAYMQAVQRAITAQNNMTDAEKQQLIAQAQLGNEVAKAKLAMIGLNVSTDAQADAADQQRQRLQDLGQNGLLDFERRLTEARNTLVGALIDSGIFTTFQTMLNDVVNFFTSPEGLAAIQTAVDSVSSFINDIIKDVKEIGLGATIKKYIGEAFSGLGQMVKDFLFGSTTDNSGAIEEKNDQLTSLGNQAGDLAVAAEAGDAGALEQLEIVQEQMRQIRNERDALVAQDGQQADGIFGNVFGDISILEAGAATVAGLLGASGAVYLAFQGFKNLVKAFGNPQVAAGALVFTGMLVGTGAAIKLAGEGISAAGDGITKVADGVERLAGLENVANFAEVAKALGEMGPALLQLGAGNVLDSIMSFFGADSPFEKIAEGIGEFADIDQTAITNMSAAGTALSTFSNLQDGLDGDKIEEYAEAIEKLAEAMKELNEALADKNDGRRESGYSVSNMLQDGTLGSGGGSGSNELNTTMQSVLSELRTHTSQNRRLITTVQQSG